MYSPYPTGKLTGPTVPKTVFEFPTPPRKFCIRSEDVPKHASEFLHQNGQFNNVWEAIVRGLFIEERYEAVAMLVLGTYGEPAATHTSLHGFAKHLHQL